MKYSKGFTLVEIMIVVAIVALLASIGYPAYQEQVQKTRRADCKGVLMESANSLERYYTSSGSYTGAVAGTNYPNRCPIDGAVVYYTVAANITGGGTGYTLTATRSGTQASDKCGDLTLTETGARSISNQNAGITANDCW